MSALKRNGKALILVMIVTAFTTGSWWYLTPIAQNVGQVNPPPLTSAQRAVLWELLANVNLDRDALVALNMTTEQAEDVLTALRNWHDESGGSVANDQIICSARLAAVRQLEREVRAGTAEPQALAAARQALATAQADWERQLDGLRGALASELTGSQIATWRAIKIGWGQSLPMRMVALTADQKQSYGRAMRQFRLAMNSATSSEERDAAQSAWQAARSNILTQDNLQVIAAYNENAANAANALNQAIENIFNQQGGVS